MEYLNHHLGGMDHNFADQGKSISRNGPNGQEREAELHSLERGAYAAVLRAFCAQSNVLSWGKEGLLTDLRNELRVSDSEHREMLATVSSDHSIKSLRDRVMGAEDPIKTDPHSPSIQNYAPSNKNKKVTITPSPKYTTPLPKTGPSPIGSQKSGPPHLLHRPNPNPNTNQKRQQNPITNVKSESPCVSPKRKKLCTDVIHIRATDKLIYEIKRVFGRDNPNPSIVEKAKLLLRDQETALMDAINKLGSVPDIDTGTKYREEGLSFKC